MAVTFFAGHSASAATKTWNNAGTVWNSDADWTGGAPANDLTSDIAFFNSTVFTNQPNYGTNSVNGIQVGDGATVTGPLILTGATLGLGSSGIVIAANAGTVTLNNAVKVGANESWSNNSSSLFTVGATITNIGNATPFTLTLNGSGSGGANLTGIISNGGATGTTALRINTTGGGVTTLSGANSFTGGLMLTSGIVRATTSASALGAGVGTLSLGGGELQLANATALNFNRATTVTGDTQITSDVLTSGLAGVTHTLGTLSIGAQTLTVAGGSNVSSGTAGLTFGATTLTGDSTFNVTNPANGGVTNLTLGALNDGTVGRTITKAGNGALSLNTAPTSLVSGTTFNVNAGTLTLGLTGAGGSAAFNLGDTAGAANATLNLFGAANSVVVRAGSTGTATIGSINSSAGVAVTIPLLTANKAVTLSPSNATANMNITSLTGTGATSVRAVGVVNYGIIGGGVTLTAANTGYSGETSVLAGTLTLSGAAANVNTTPWLGTSANNVVIGDTSGIQSARFVLAPAAGATGTSFTRGFTIQAGNGGLSVVGITANPGGMFSGNFTLNKSVYLVGPNSTSSGGGPTTYSGTFSKGAGVADAVSVITSGDRNGYIQFTNSGNTYDGGTVVGSGVFVASAGSLGSGNAVVETGALRLGSLTSLAANKTVHVGSLGSLSIGATTITQSYLQSVIDATSSGAVQIGTGATAFSNVLDLSTIGNGSMYLGADQAAGGAGAGSTYSGATLGANLDGNYRLGFGGSVQSLTISNGVIGGSSQLIVGGAAGYIFPGTAQGTRTEGIVVLNAANAYSGGTTVNNRSQLRGLAQTSGSPFGTGAVTLHDSTLRLLNNGTLTTNTTLGNVAYDGASTIQADGVTGGSNTLNLGALTRNNNGTLIIGTAGTGAVLGTTAFVKTSSTLNTTAITTTAGASTMVDPYFTDASGNYLTYDANNGFVPITTAFGTIGAATGTNSIVKTAAAEVITGSKTIAALTLGGVGGAITSTTGNFTLTVANGGINMSGSAAATIGTTGASNNIVLDFNGKEAVFTSSTANQLTINNAINNAAGLTKAGNNTLALASTASTFTGNITINQGSLQVNSDLALGNLDNDIFLNGGALLTGNTNTGASITLNALRTITVGTAGGTIYTGSDGSLNGFNLTVAGKVTGTGGFLALNTATSLNLNASAGNPNVTITLSNAANDFVAPIYIGSNTGGRVALAFSDNLQLGDLSNSVSLVGGNAILQYTGAASTSVARSINFLDEGGSIEVTNPVTLTVSGPISGSGLFNKNGVGTLALTGASTFSGNTDVNAGVLNVSNANALGATTAVVSGNSGVSGGAVYVQNGAALELQGGISLSGVGGKTVYLNGSGVGSAGALRNVSGANSNAGQVILQTNATIGVDAGSLALTGVVSGAGTLTKTGAGMLSLAGANTYTGATSVSGGTLLINGSTLASSAFTINSTATLGGVGVISGSVNILANATINPGGVGLAGSAAAVGGLTTGALTLAPSGVAIFDVSDASTYDQLLSNGAVNLGGATLNVTVNSGAVFSGTGALHLITGSSLTGTFAGINDGDTITYNGYDFTADYTATGFDLDYTMVPEPSTYMAGVFALCILVLHRRRFGRAKLRG